MNERQQGPFLSVVIPAYNEETRLPPTLTRIAEFLRAQTYTSEVLVVENGSTDRTGEVVEEFIAHEVHEDDRFEMRLLHSAKGKGAAVKQGALCARGDFVLVTDTDLAVPIAEVSNFLPPALDVRHYGVAIASREIAGAVRHDEPAYRHLMGRVFNFLVRVMAVPEIHDTQCGFKCFSRESARTIFPLQRIDGWGFDVEVLYIARHHDIPIVEIPVHWYYGSDSRVRPIHDTVTMFSELMKIRRNGRNGLYDSPAGPAVTDRLAA